MIDVRGTVITVVGAARSGVAAAIMLQRKGAQVFVTDSGAISEAMKARLSDAAITFEEGGHSDKAYSADFIVISPGVPSDAPIVAHYLAAGKGVYSEIEAAYWYCKSPIIAITGSNGKTTTTNWIAYCFEQAKHPFILAGNIGFAFSEFVDQTNPETVVVLEVSSFQLDHIKYFKPKVSVLLNVTPDHLNRYKYDFELYLQSKLRIFENQDAGDTLVFGFDDPNLKHRIAQAEQQRPSFPTQLAFSTETSVHHGAWSDTAHIHLTHNAESETLMPVNQVFLPGKHNLANGLATVLATRAFELKNELLRDCLSSFEGVEHRLERVRELNGVRYINDSKATNVNAVWYALQSFQEPMVLIMGGRDKGNDYEELKPLIKERVHTLIAIGEGAAKVETQLGGIVPNFMHAGSMEEAVKQAKKWAKRGEVVLLSPACASFDMFNSYEHRGEMFKKCVLNLD